MHYPSLVPAGSPTPPSSVWHNVTDSEQYINLHWDSNTACGIDCHMIMITVDSNNLLNTSYQAGTATVDISKYHSNDSIAIKMYGVNKCGMMSSHYTEETVILGMQIQYNASNIVL